MAKTKHHHRRSRPRCGTADSASTGKPAPSTETLLADIEQMLENEAYDNRHRAGYPDALYVERMVHGFQRWAREGRIQNFSQLQEIIRERGFENIIEEIKREDAAAVEPRHRALHLAHQALLGLDYNEIESLSAEALALDPDCLDARTAAASVIDELPKQLKRFESNLKWAEQKLKKKLNDCRPKWCASLELRPYMRMVYHYALALLASNRPAEALDHLSDLLDDSGYDILGARRHMIPLALLADDVEYAKDLIESFHEDRHQDFVWSAVFLYWRTTDFEKAERWLEIARAAAPGLERNLTGNRDRRPPSKKVAPSVLTPLFKSFPMAQAWLQTGGYPGDGDYWGLMKPPEEF